MGLEELYGYTGLARKKLEEAGAKIGDRIRIRKGDVVYEGTLMPRTALSQKPFIVVKLDNGYNVGVKVDESTVVERICEYKKPTFVSEARLEKKEGLPNVVIISTGGTIACRVDYATGAVHPALTSRDLVSVVPEVSELANIDARVLFSILSENMTPKHWEATALEVAKAIEEGADGVVVAHGTDTMAYTAAALAFALRNLPVPVVLVGAQRSSDRPSSDAAFNLQAAVLTAGKAPFAESVVVMHGETGDSYALVHRGVKVRKMHTSRRDAFQSINDYPLAMVDIQRREIKMLRNDYAKRDRSKQLEVQAKFDEKVFLLKAFPGITGEIIDFLVDKGYHGIVLEGTGLGHFPEHTIDSIKRAVEEGVAVVMTSQCLFGRVNMNVYSTGRKLLAAGVIPCEDMLPETALVKLMWVLAQTRDLNEVRKLMLTNIAGEINNRITVDLYPRWPLCPA